MRFAAAATRAIAAASPLAASVPINPMASLDSARNCSFIVYVINEVAVRAQPLPAGNKEEPAESSEHEERHERRDDFADYHEQEYGSPDLEDQRPKPVVATRG